MNGLPATEAELRQEHARAVKAGLRMDFHAAVASESVCLALTAAIKRRRRLAALSSRKSAIPHHIQEPA